jgi:hypothetical protein
MEKLSWREEKIQWICRSAIPIKSRPGALYGFSVLFKTISLRRLFRPERKCIKFRHDIALHSSLPFFALAHFLDIPIFAFNQSPFNLQILRLPHYPTPVLRLHAKPSDFDFEKLILKDSLFRRQLSSHGIQIWISLFP